MKLAVHWAPAVSVWTPGCTAAVAAGAHAGTLWAGAVPATPAKTRSAEATRAAAGTTRRRRIATTYPHRTAWLLAPELGLPGLSGDVQQDPSRPHGDHQGRATKGHERQGDAGDGKDADHGADVDERLTDHPRRDAGSQQGAEAVGGLQGRAHAENGEGGEKTDHQQRADEPQLLTDDGEDEVGV